MQRLVRAQLFLQEGDGAFKVIDTLRILADCRVRSLKLSSPLRGSRPWESSAKKAARARGVETLRVSSGLGELRCSALSKVGRLGITVKREPAGWLKKHDRGSLNRARVRGERKARRR